jgi:hypothetical protein
MQRLSPAKRRHRWWATALLPALLLRALIPAGFMPAVGAGSPGLVFCEPGAAGTAALPAHHHHPHGHDDAGHGSHRAAGECPFAQSAAPALPAAPALACLPLPIATLAATAGEDQVFLSVPLRHAAARGPPESC